MQLLCSLTITLLLAMSACADSPQLLPGHMKPLGSHRPPEQLVERLVVPPLPLHFAQYVSRRQPVVIERLIENTEVFRNLQSDDYLRKKYGEAYMNVEVGKKETGSTEGMAMTIAEYLDRYEVEDIYLVGDLSEAMKEEWVLPRFLLCGGYTENIAVINMWFSSGGTKSLLHSDTSENLHCVVSGQKKFVIIDPKYASNIGQEYSTKGYFDIDVDKVDMTVYGGLAEVPWMLAEVNAGDCLYIPSRWLHQVNSFGRNLGINVWWVPFQFRHEECVDTDNLPPFGTVGGVRVSPELHIRQYLVIHARSDGTIHAEDIHKTLAETVSLDADLQRIKEMFEILQPGCDGILRKETIEDIPLERFAAAEKHVFTFTEETGTREREQDHRQKSEL